MPPSVSRLIADALGLRPPEGPLAVPLACGLCGAVAPGQRADAVLKDTFTNRDELRAPWLCWACAGCLADRRTRSHFLVAAGGFEPLARAAIWPLLLGPPEPPFVLYTTASGKKHGFWRAGVAMSRGRFRIQCEDVGAWFEPARDREWMRLAALLVRDGVRREAVATGRYSSADYGAVGVARLRAAERELELLRPSDRFAVVFGLLPGPDTLETWHD